MYRVVFYRVNQKKSKIFDTFGEAMDFWSRLPFETFCELYKL